MKSLGEKNWSSHKVFITGSSGLLGSHLTRILQLLGAQVVALVRDGVPNSLFNHESEDWNLHKKVTVVRGEIENFRLIERVLNEYEIDTIFHLAAQTIVGVANRNPIATFKANIEGTWNILEAARIHQDKIKRILIASSDKAYGNLKGNSYDESYPLAGEHPYDVSKSCADLISTAYYKTYGLPVAITRCGNFFGPGDLNFNRIVPGTIRDILMGRNPVIRSDGSYIRDYIFAEDGARAYLRLAEKMLENERLEKASPEKTSTEKTSTENVSPAKASRVQFGGEAFNFSYGLRLSALDMVKKLLNLMGREDLAPKILNQATNEIPVQSLDSSKARSLLGWEPSFGFEQGLKLTIKWYEELFRTKH